MQVSNMIVPALLLLMSVVLNVTGSSAALKGDGKVLADPELLNNISVGLAHVNMLTPEGVDVALLTPFYVGVKAMFNFWYDLAEEQLVQTQKADPSFGLAYWGQAMCQMKFLWNSKNSSKACSILKKMDTNHATLMAENKYLVDSAVVLFGCDNNKLTEEQRLDNYVAILKDAVQAHSGKGDELFVNTWYALALLEQAKSFNSVQAVEARAVLNRVLAKKPKHPYALHVFIHAHDNTALARLALEQARLYPEVVFYPNHAVHMAANIYIHLGMWKEAMNSDRKALNMAEDFAKKYKGGSLTFDADNRYHSMEYLHYELLQLGNYKEAKKLLGQMRLVVLVENSAKYLNWYYRMMARQWLETRSFNLEVLGAMPAKDSTPFSADTESGYLLAYGLSLLKSQDPDKLTKVQDVIGRMTDISSKSPYISKAADMMKLELQAQVEISSGKGSKLERSLKAFTLMDKAVQIQETMVNTPSTTTIMFVPSWEYYGHMILQTATKDPKSLDKAIALFQRSVEKVGKRSLSLMGLARAYELRGDHASAVKCYRELRKHWNPIRP